MSAFSTRTETEGFAGFSIIDLRTKEGKGTRTGLIFPHNTYPRIPGVSDEKMMGKIISSPPSP